MGKNTNFHSKKIQQVIVTLMIFLNFGWASDLDKTLEDSKIINGTLVPSTDNTWESIVALKWNNSQYCGGSLISSRWILTAAHCLVDNNGDVYPVQNGDTVGIGNYNLNNTTNYAVKQFIVFPSYNATTFNNDIGLVELVSNVTEVSSIAYDTNHNLATNTPTKVAGWGNQSTTSNVFDEYLREALVPIVSSNVCNSALSYNGKITNNMICAGYMSSNRDSCQGDSGGPLIVDNTLIGIVSWGYGCAQENYPGVYTKVQNYTSWIKNYVSENKIFLPIIMDDIITFVPTTR